MKDKLDPLIRDRAAWLFSDRPGTAAVRALLDHLLGYRETCILAQTFRDLPAARIMEIMGRMLSQDVEVTGLEHLPRSGPALIVANHPTGIADGIILHRLIAARRPDTFFFANHDILRVLPQMDEMIAPVEWRAERRSHAKTRQTMDYARRAFDAGRLGVIFPSGRLAKRRGLHLYERPWMPSAAALARKFDLPVVPVRIAARNSTLFYAFDLLHNSLRDITLFHETLNKAGQRFEVGIGAPIRAAALPADTKTATEMLRRTTLCLNDRPMELPLWPRRQPSRVISEPPEPGMGRALGRSEPSFLQ